MTVLNVCDKNRAIILTDEIVPTEMKVKYKSLKIY